MFFFYWFSIHAYDTCGLAGLAFLVYFWIEEIIIIFNSNNNNNNNKKRYNKDGEDAKKLDPLDPSTGKIEPGSFDTRLSLVDNIATLVEKEKAVLQLQLEEKEKALLDTQNLLKQLSKYSIPYI